MRLCPTPPPLSPRHRLHAASARACHLQPLAEIAEGSPPLALPAPTPALLREHFTIPEVDDGGRPLLPARSGEEGEAGLGEAEPARAAAADAELEALAPQVRPQPGLRAPEATAGFGAPACSGPRCSAPFPAQPS